MSPVAGVKFLPMQQQIGSSRSRIEACAEVCNVRNTLFLVDDEILDDREIFRCRLRHQVPGRIPISSSIVHVNVYICTDPLRTHILWEIQRLQANYQPGCLSSSHRQAPPLEAVLEPLHDLHLGTSSRKSQFGST